MLLGPEYSVEPIRNIDHMDMAVSVEYLEQSPPCRAYYDIGGLLKEYVYQTFLSKIYSGREEKEEIYRNKDKGALESRKKRIKDKMLQAIGGLPEAGISLNPIVTGVVDRDGYQIEKIIFLSRPGVYVTGNLYLPAGITKKTAAVLFLCGHAELAKAYPEYQYACRLLAKAGIVALAIDPVGQGERFSYLNPRTKKQMVEWGCPEHDHAGVQAVLTGFSTARYFVHDAMRAVDFLMSRPEVDVTKIGVTGNSGGGTQTSLMMLLDERIAAAAPGTFISSMEAILKSGLAQDSEQIWNGMVGEGFDHDDIILAAAPKPVMILSTQYDFFPIEGTEATYSSAEKFYELYGKLENLEIFTDRTEHCYSKKMAQRAAGFFSRHLLGKPFYGENVEENPLPPEKCWCTKSGQVSLDYPDAVFLFEENKREADRIIAGRKALAEDRRKKLAVSWLEEKVNFNRLPCRPNLRRFGKIETEGLRTEAYLFWSNENMFSNLLCFTSEEEENLSGQITIAVWEGGTKNLVPHMEFIKKHCRKREKVFVLDLSGYGALSPYRNNTMPMYGFEGPICSFSYDLIWQGDSFPALHTFEIMSVMSMLKSELGIDAEKISLYAEGYPSIPLAAAIMLFKERFKYVEYAGETYDFDEIVREKFYDSRKIAGKIFPEVLQNLWIPELLKWSVNKTNKE